MRSSILVLVFSGLSACFGDMQVATDGTCHKTVTDTNGVEQQVEVACSEAATSDPDTSGTTTTVSMAATAAESEIYGAAVGEYGYCIASWVNTYPQYSIGTFGDGFGPDTGWQIAVATASVVNGSYCTSFRNFGGGAFRWGAAIIDPATFEPLIWIELDELPESVYIIDVLECDLDDPEDLVRKQSFCAAYDDDGNAIEADCGLTYVAPPECSEDEDTDDNGDDTDDAGGGTIDDEDDDTSSGTRTSVDIAVAPDSTSTSWNLSVANVTSWDWDSWFESTSTSTGTQTESLAVASGDVIRINGTYGDGYLVENDSSLDCTVHISSISIGGTSYSLTTATSGADCVCYDTGTGWDLQCTIE